VDFVVYGEDFFAAFEVKQSRTIRPEHLRGLKSFGEDYPEARLYLLHCGPDARKIGNIACIPCEVFLRGLRPNGLP
jgi:hypothetical protein